MMVLSGYLQHKKRLVMKRSSEQEYAKKSFDNVAEYYDTIDFFKIASQHIVNIIKQKKPDAVKNVLDIACGTGNVIMAYASSSKDIHFHGVDLSENMLNKAKERAKAESIENVTFTVQDVMQMDDAKKYDIVTCAYALFFLPNASTILAKLVSMLQEEGMVIFTSFTDEAFNPATDILLTALRKHGSTSAIEFQEHRWENLKTPSDIAHLCKQANINNFHIETKEIRYQYSIDAWWELFNNTGYKGMLMELDTKAYTCVKKDFFASMKEHCDVENNVLLIADSYFVVVKDA